MTDLNFDIAVNDRGGNGALGKLADNLDKTSKSAKRAEDAQLKLSAATVRGRKAAVDLSAAEAHLTKIMADGTSTTEEKARAQLAVDKAQVQVAKSSRDASRATEQLGSATGGTVKSTKLSTDALVGAGVAAAAGALAIRKIISASMDFEKTMSGVGAVSNASAAELTSLRQAALDAGRDTAFSAAEAAVAETELAKAGVSTSDILSGALRGSLDLAAAGQLDLGESATIAAQAMNIFDLAGTDVAHIADVLAAGANKSAADVGQLGQAMQQGGLVASQLGISFDDTIGVLSAFADNALMGSDAGTSLKTMLLALAGPSETSASKMRELGINAFDATGQFVGLQNLAGILQSKLGKLTDEQRNAALATIFGTDAIRAANILYSQGSSGVANYTDAVDDTGAASRNAAAQLDNLSGDLDGLQGSLETALIKTGSQANNTLRFLAKHSTEAVNAFSELPGPVQGTAFGLLAVGTSGLAALATIGTLVPKVREARESLAGMGRAGAFANTAIGRIGKALTVSSATLIGLGAAGLLLDKMTKSAVGAAPGVEAVKSQLIELAAGTRSAQLSADAVSLLAEEIRRLADPSLGDKAAKTVLNIASLGQADPAKLVEARQNIGSIDQALADLVRGGNSQQAKDAFEQLTKAVASGGVSVDQAKRALPLYSEALTGAGNAAKLASDETDGATSSTTLLDQATKSVTGAIKEEKSAADQLKDSIDALNGNAISAAEADDSFRTSVLDLRDAIKDNGKHVDLSTAKTGAQSRAIIANREAIFTAIKAAEAHATAVTQQTGSVNAGNAVFAQHIKTLRQTLAAAGVLPAEIQKIIDSYARVPTIKRTRFEVEQAAALAAAARIQKAITQIKGRPIHVQVTADNTIQRVQHDINNITGKAINIIVNGKIIGGSKGGTVVGGTPGKDSVPALLMPGERVLTVSEARNYKLHRSVPLQETAPGGGVTISPGALQLTINGGRDTTEIERVVDAAFRQFAIRLEAGGRR